MATDAQYDRYLMHGADEPKCQECGDPLGDWSIADYCDWCDTEDEEEDDCE